MKLQAPTYQYEVFGFLLDTREAAREKQRSLRSRGLSKASTKIIETLTTQRVIR